MDDQNYRNSQSGGGSDNNSNYYQDYTSDMQQYQPPSWQNGNRNPNGLQIASLVLGLLALPGCCCYGILGLLMGIIGLILAIIGNSRNRGNGVGIAGLVCSIISIIFGILATIYFVLVIMGLYGYGPLAELLKEMGYGFAPSGGTW